MSAGSPREGGASRTGAGGHPRRSAETHAPSAPAAPPRRSRLVAVLALGVAIMVLAGGAAAYRALRRPALPVYWAAPSFTLLDQAGDTLRSAELRGTPWVVSFVFTNCTSICSLITTEMAALRDSLRAEGALGTRVRLVSLSVDPARDTPAVLRRYAARFGGSPPGEWAFLTGMAPEAMRGMIQQGFRVTASGIPAEERAGGNYQVMHSPRVVLVDGAGQVRGLYDATEAGAMARLHRDLHRLL